MSLLNSVLQQILCRILSPVRNGSGLISWVQCSNFWDTHMGQAEVQGLEHAQPETHSLLHPSSLQALQAAAAMAQCMGVWRVEKTAGR